jgi:2-phosphosulfolactate phosphatase
LKTAVNLEFFLGDAVSAVRRQDVVVIIDVLRCCSTIVTALVNGASAIVPATTLKEARALYGQHPASVLAGERRGVKPKGFALGNSPLEFTGGRVKGKHVILTTTSGTRAIVLSRDARVVLTGALLNAKAVAEAASRIAEREEIGISFVLSGRRRYFFIEDFLCAGAIAEYLEVDDKDFSDSVVSATLCFRQAQDHLESAIASGGHATYLKNIGFREDVKFCSRLNVFRVVPLLKDSVIVQLVGHESS